MTTSTVQAPAPDAPVPFWRNVKTLGIIAQIVFVLWSSPASACW